MSQKSFYFSVFLSLLAILFLGCEEVLDCSSNTYENLEVLENTYTGRIDVTSRGADPGADFYGNGDSGTYSFAWKNSLATADVNFDITTPTGSVQMIINDCQGVEVLNKTRSAGGNDTFSGVTDRGSAGTWQVTLILTDFNGDGSYSLSPGD